MAAQVATVAFLGLEARAVEVQVQIASGLPKFLVVGLPDKAVGESRERVHAALAAIGLSLPPKRITVNLSPADLRDHERLLSRLSPSRLWKGSPALSRRASTPPCARTPDVGESLIARYWGTDQERN